MAKFKQVIQSYLFTKVTEYFGNLAKNWDGDVRDGSMFDVIAGCFDRDKALELIRVAFTPSEIQVMTHAQHRRDRLDLTDGLDHILQCIWNNAPFRKKCKILLEEIVSLMLAETESQNLEDEPIARRFTELQRLVKLNALETDILRVAYMRQQTCFCWPRRVDTREKAVFYAMALDRSHAEVQRALSPKGRLLKLNLLDGELELNAGMLLGFLDGTDSEAISQRFYRKVDGKVLPWEYFGARAEKEGVLLTRMLKGSRGNRCNILLYGVPGTGKSSFARALAKRAGYTAFEVLQGDDGKGLKADARILGISICNSQEDAGDSLMVIDEADELLRNNSGSFGIFGFDLGGRTTEKGVTNALLDEMKMPAIWISNALPDTMDESVRRRFDYAIRFDALNSTQRVAIWRNIIEKEGLTRLIPESALGDYAAKYATSAGGIATVLGNVKRMDPTPEEVSTLVAELMKSHCELMEVRSENRFLPAKDYSLDGLNIKGKTQPADIVFAAKNYLDTDFCGAGADRPRLNILLWGAPGTGKTEFVKYLGQALDRKVIVKKGSDILSKWVGGSEANIAAAFREAAAEQAILFFDEIDGLIQDRADATHSWEVSQVNELLQQMENFDGIMVAATNLRENLDAASLRRFTFKLEFDYLDDDGKKTFFRKMFGTGLTAEEEAELRAIPNLAPGDYRTVRQSQYFLGRAVSNADRLAALREEVAVKKDGSRHAQIGFAS